MNETCEFCDIASGNAPKAKVVYRDSNVIAFVPTNPATLGHVLVVPRRHIPDIWNLTKLEGEYLSQITLLLAGTMREALTPEGLNVIQSNGASATQTIEHLHIHLVPRWQDDAMGPIWPDRTEFSEREKEDTFQIIKWATQALHYSVDSSDLVSGADRRKHLDYIQAVISRQAKASAATKSWLLPMITATFGFALAQQSWPLAVLGIVAVFLFACLDVNYLKSERRYRILYDEAIRNNTKIPLFSLDPGEAVGLSTEAATTARRLQPTGARKRDASIWSSWSIAPFYITLLLLGAGVFAVSILKI